MSEFTMLVAIAVVEHNDRFLIGKRPPGITLAGLWEFPGGKVEPNETPAAAARRECLEETGVPVSVGSPLLVTTQQYEHGCIELHFFSCAPIQPLPDPDEPFRWVTRSKLTRYEFPAGNRTVLDLLLKKTK